MPKRKPTGFLFLLMAAHLKFSKNMKLAGSVKGIGKKRLDKHLII
jgi:hypothetical protein